MLYLENYNGVLLHKEDYILLLELEGIIGKKLGMTQVFMDRSLEALPTGAPPPKGH